MSPIGRVERGRRVERGDVMLWVAVAAPFLVIGLSALISASQYWELRREVQAQAAAAARAGAQPDAIELRLSDDRADPRGEAAGDRARQRVLAVVGGDHGIVDLDRRVDVQLVVDGAGGEAVTVELEALVPYRFSAFGMPRSVTGRATAVAVEATG